MANFKGFKGKAIPINDVDLPRIGAQIGVGEDELHAFMEAETRGSGFDNEGRPRILFERHKFYKYCPEKKRAAAVKSGLANPKAGGYGKESEQYGKLAKAMAIDEHAALLSCSWGLAQVMGFNHELAGYPTVEAMVLAFMDSEASHLQAAVDFIQASGLGDELRRHNWKGFAKGYNGSGYSVNKYDQKLAAAFAKWQKIKDTPYAPEARPAPAVAVSADLYDGKPHPEVENVQKRLNDLGYPEFGSIDGKWGTKTAAAILAFRNDNGLPTEAVIDEALLAALMTAKPREIAPARANATVSDLRKEDVPEIKATDQTKIGGYLAGGAGTLVAAEKGLDVAEKYNGLAERAKNLIEPISNLITDNLWLILIGVGGFVVWKSGVLQRIRLEKHQTAQDVSV